MSSRDGFAPGALAGMLLAIGAASAHWFITPAHVTASTARTIGVAVQAVLAFGIATAIWLRHRRTRQGARAA